VVDVQGRALQGAKVVADPGGSSALSDAQGQFTLNALSAGDYDVTISYAGFATFTQKVTVAAGQSARLDASLSVASAKQDVQV
jgi:Carboxypeptidase regulatory-like domain